MTNSPRHTPPDCNVPIERTDYPPPKIPLTPPVSAHALSWQPQAVASLLDIQHIRVSAGRAAITLALQHAAIGKGDEVLVPAYHCESMIAPVEYVGARPVYYRVHNDTSVDLEDIAQKTSRLTRAILATHYFGFPQLMSELREYADRHELILVEDCAHAFFGHKDNRQLGSFGDYAVGSAMKFFPLFDGGLLASNTRDLQSISLFRPTMSLELKGLVSIVEYAMQYDRLSMLRAPLKIAVALKDAAWKTAKRTMGKKLEKSLAPSSSQGGYALEPQWIRARMSRISTSILTHCKGKRIYEVRRRNYQRIVQALADEPGIRPLFPELPDGIVPLVVPMIMENPERLFPVLKQAGVPIWRFGEYLHPEIDESICRNTIFLSKHVFQFPCHSELRDDEIAWMIDAIKVHLQAQDTSG